MKQWDSIFKKKGKFFEDIHSDLPNLVKLFKKNNVKRILDLGSGTGRHILYLAKQGFDVYGFDISPTGINITKKQLRKEGLKANLIVHDMNKRFPYNDNFFDAVISIQTIHHNTFNKIKKTIKEIDRVIKKKGIIFITVPKRKSVRVAQDEADKTDFSNKFKIIDKNTLVPLNGEEKGLPHFYFNEKLIKEVFNNFNIKKIYTDTINHYCFIGIKK